MNAPLRVFALDQVTVFLTWFFAIGIWLPLFAGGLDSGLGILTVVGGLGLAWSVRALRPPALLGEGALVWRTALRARRYELRSIQALERDSYREHRYQCDALFLTLKDGERVTIDLLLVRDADGFVRELARATGRSVTVLRPDP